MLGESLAWKIPRGRQGNARGRHSRPVQAGPWSCDTEGDRCEWPRSEGEHLDHFTRVHTIRTSPCAYINISIVSGFQGPSAKAPRLDIHTLLLENTPDSSTNWKYCAFEALDDIQMRGFIHNGSNVLHTLAEYGQSLKIKLHDWALSCLGEGSSRIRTIDNMSLEVIQASAALSPHLLPRTGSPQRHSTPETPHHQFPLALSK